MFLFNVFLFAIWFVLSYWFGTWMQKKLGKEYAFWWTFFFNINGAIFSILLKLYEEKMNNK